MDFEIGIAYPAFIECFEDMFKTKILDLSVYSNRIELSKKLNNLKLVIFSGGEDINPRIYNQRNNFSQGINDERDRIELDILSRVLEIKYLKILGICRGHQLINAYFGGGLCQDIYLNGLESHPTLHEISWAFNGILKEIFPKVNSLHHQGVTFTGSSLQNLGIYKHIIEATFSKNKIFSVQWHPEFMYEEGKEFDKIIKKWIKGEKPLQNILMEKISPHVEEKISNPSIENTNKEFFIPEHEDFYAEFNNEEDYI